VATEVVDDGTRRGRDGRRYRTAHEREAILERLEASGLAQRAFAEREGIKYSTLLSWLHARRARSAGQGARAHADGGEGMSVRFREVALTGLGSVLEVVLADGTRVRGGTPAQVAEVVVLLRR
jgi:hypothetical protein